MKKLWIYSVLFSAFVLCAGNVSICGAGYGRHDIKIIINRVLVRQNVIYQHKNIGEKLEYDKYKNSKLLIICSSLAQKPSAEDINKLKNWISNGGTLLLTGRAINSLGKVKEVAAWTGFRYVSNAKEYEIKAVKADSPLLKGFEFFSFKDVLATSVTPPAQIILGNGKNCFLGQRKLGKGMIYVAVNEYFRMAAKKNNHPFQKEYLKILQNIVDLARPTSDGNVQLDQLSAWQKKRGR